MINTLRKLAGRFAITDNSHHSIFHKAINMQMAIDMQGDYLEFGVFQGKSLIQAYDRYQYFHKNSPYWQSMRFFAFDSFEGIPVPTGIDAKVKGFIGRECFCGESEFLANLKKVGIDLKKVTTIKGFYKESLTSDLRERLKIKQASIIHIDCDLYESSIQALDFCTPYVANGTLIAFDDWFLFGGHPGCGQQKAFQEWLDKNPELVAVQYQKEATFRNSFILNKREIY